MSYPVIMLIADIQPAIAADLPFFVCVIESNQRLRDLLQYYNSPPEGMLKEKIISDLCSVIKYDILITGDVTAVYVVTKGHGSDSALSMELSSEIGTLIDIGAITGLKEHIIDYVITEYQLRRNPVAVSVAIRDACIRGGNYAIGKDRVIMALTEYYTEEPEALRITIEEMATVLASKHVVPNPQSIDPVQAPMVDLSLTDLDQETIEKISMGFANRVPSLFISRDMLDLLEQLFSGCSSFHFENNDDTHYTISVTMPGRTSKHTRIIRPLLGSRFPTGEPSSLARITSNLFTHLLKLLP